MAAMAGAAVNPAAGDAPSASTGSSSMSVSINSADASRRTKSGSKTSASRSSSKKSRAKEEDVAAVRRLRMIIETIAANENAPPSVRTRQIADLENLCDRAEKRLHFRGDKFSDDPLGLLDPPTAAPAKDTPKKKRGWLKAKFLGNKQKNKNPSSPSNKQDVRKMMFGGALETLEEEVRGDVDVMRGQMEEGRDVSAPVVADDDDNTAGTATDSIMDLRNQNSEDYVASVCSLRSLGTFEKDFINNIIQEQMEMDDISQSTFEKDFMARQAAAVPPTQVFTGGDGQEMDDLTVDTKISETTFEQDARSILTPKDRLNPQPGVAAPSLPLQVVTNSNANGDDIEDDITIGTINSETTYERDQRLKGEAQRALGAGGSAPTAFAVFDTITDTLKNAMSNDSQISVSTFEKDAAALNALAVKIGRKPSTTAKVVESGILATASDRSHGTFEQDTMMMAQAKMGAMGALGIAKNDSELSTSTFEKDMGVRSAKPKLNAITEVPVGMNTGIDLQPFTMHQQQTLSPMSLPSIIGSPGVSPRAQTVAPPVATPPVEGSASVANNHNPGWFNTNQAEITGNFSRDLNVGAFERNASRSMGASVATGATGLSAAAQAANAEAAAQNSLPKISPLVVELSPNAIDRGVKSRNREGMWGRLLCHFGS